MLRIVRIFMTKNVLKNTSIYTHSQYTTKSGTPIYIIATWIAMYGLYYYWHTGYDKSINNTCAAYCDAFQQGTHNMNVGTKYFTYSRQKNCH